MIRFASSLVASAVIVFMGTSALAAINDPHILPPPRPIHRALVQPKVIATVVAHAHRSATFAVHGL